MTEGRSRRRAPRELAHALRRVRRQAAPPTTLAAVQECWSAAVGAAVAREAEPVSERDGLVTVHCRSAVWAAELTMLAEGLLERLNRELAEGRQVHALRFIARPQ